MRRLALALLLSGCIGSRATAMAGEELNLWPFYVEDAPATDQEAPRRSAAGPFFFSQSVSSDRFDGASEAVGFRPFFVKLADPRGTPVQAFVLYPLFSYRRMTDGYRWSVFEIINHYAVRDVPTDPTTQRALDIWPFYFSRETGSPDSSYHAVFPVAGAVKNRFGQDRLSWFLFPLYGKFEKNRVTTTTAPWPFIKVLSGEGNHGFEMWPLFGFRGKENIYREQFYLWPLLYRNESKLNSPRPEVREGFLPFYAAVYNQEVRSEMFTPFFGYVDRVAPVKYHETDYLWPIWIQGRGDGYMINRWGPFYTHSQIRGTDTKWFAWPLWKQQSWIDGGLKHSKRQLFYFIYNETQQQSATHSNLPVARKAHYWPFVSIWDNGAGRRQLQILSPLEVFFPNNDPMRLSFTPFFALYRYNKENSDRIEHSLLWNFITFRHSQESREFHIGPIYSETTNSEEKRYNLGNGLLSLKHKNDGRWTLSFCNFEGRPEKRFHNASAP